MKALFKAIKSLAPPLAIRSLSAQRRWRSLRDLVLLILANCERDVRHQPRRWERND